MNLSNLTTEELRNVARLTYVDDYENIYVQQVKNIFIAASPSISTPIQYLDLEL